jgi:hypothetical protein
MRPVWKWLVAAALTAVVYGQGGATIVMDRKGDPIGQTGGDRVKAEINHDRPPYRLIGAIARDEWLARCMTWPWRWFARPAPRLPVPPRIPAAPP